jgi:hypothetical protein
VNDVSELWSLLTLLVVAAKFSPHIVDVLALGGRFFEEV